MSKNDVAGAFEYIKNWDPVFACRLHTYVTAVIAGEPLGKFFQPFGKRGEPTIGIRSYAAAVGRSNTGVNKGFVDIQSTAYGVNDFKHLHHPFTKCEGCRQ